MVELSTVDKIFTGSWGIFQDYRKEVEGSSFGKLQAIEAKAMRDKFIDIKEVALVLKCSPATARKRIDGWGESLRFIIDGKKFLYLREDFKVVHKKIKAAEKEA